MSSSPLLEDNLALPVDGISRGHDLRTPPSVPQESFHSVPDVQMVDYFESKVRCVFAVSPDLAHPIKTVSRCAVSSRNTLALVTNGHVTKEGAHNPTEPGRNSSQNVESWPPSVDEPPGKRTLRDVRKEEGRPESFPAPTRNGLGTEENIEKASTVYCCDLDRPWRLFPVFDFPANTSIVAWSPCGQRLLLCTDVFCYVISSKHSTLNSWKLLKKIRLTSSAIIHASWTKPLTTFVYCPDQTSESFFEIPVRPKISLSSESQNSVNNDGFFVVSRTGEIVLVDIVLSERMAEINYEFITWSGVIEGDHSFSTADAVYDFDEQCFMLALASTTNPDVISVTFPIPDTSVIETTTSSTQQGRPLRKKFTEGITNSFPLQIETATNLHTKNNIIALRLIISAKIKFLLASTKTFEHDYMELWELSTSDVQKNLLDDPAIVPSDKPTWTLMATQKLPEIFQCWTLAPERFLSNDIDTSLTVSVALRGGIVALYTVKLGLEVAIVEAGQTGSLQATQYVRGRSGTKRTLVTPEAVAFVTSANGCMTYMLDSACRLWVRALPVSLWPIVNISDMLEVFLTVELDFSDLISALPEDLCRPAKQKLDILYENLNPSRKKVCSPRYLRLMASLSQKTEDRVLSIVPLQSLLYDAVLVYLEQYVDMRSASLRVEASLFQLTEFWSAVQKPDITLEQVATLVRSNFTLGSDVLRLLMAGFHVIIHEIVSLLELVGKEPALAIILTDVFPKLRAILSLIFVWTSSVPNFRQFFTRSTFAVPGQKVIEVLFDIVSLLMGIDKSSQEWVTEVTDRLDEANLRSKSTYHEWARTFQQAEPRASCLKSPADTAGHSLKWLHYTWSYNFLPSHSEHSKTVVATGVPDTDTFNLRPAKRKYCSRCFYSFPWRPTTEYTGTWHSHMRHRWSTCFCGGPWIFLE